MPMLDHLSLSSAAQGSSNGTFIIAEAGVNHNGSLEVALRLVDAAKAAGADAVKFQGFKVDRLVAKGAPKAAYQRAALPGDDEQYGMLKALELSGADFEVIYRRCRAADVEFMASPFDEDSADQLVALGMRAVKVASGEITNLPLLRHVGALGRPVILSTGMSWLGEVETAVRCLVDAGTEDLTLLHCVTEYPTPPEEVNLRAMETMRMAFGLPVGFSDHTPGTEIAVAAVALGATVIEKHLTLDKSLPGPDHKASLDPSEFTSMVAAIRNVERALGNGKKAPAPCEVPNIVVARKSLVSARPLEAGRKLTLEDIAVKRPGTGIDPGALQLVVGRTLAVDVEADHVLRWSDLA